MSRFSISLFLFFFVASLDAIWAAPLEGTVFDPGGKAVPGARVSLKRALIAIKAMCAQTLGFPAALRTVSKFIAGMRFGFPEV
jgi:hypothetical protein